MGVLVVVGPSGGNVPQLSASVVFPISSVRGSARSQEAVAVTRTLMVRNVLVGLMGPPLLVPVKEEKSAFLIG
jgi:hypothetical protein